MYTARLNPVSNSPAREDKFGNLSGNVVAFELFAQRLVFAGLVGFLSAKKGELSVLSKKDVPDDGLLYSGKEIFSSQGKAAGVG
jgi:hypothetical protein